MVYVVFFCFFFMTKYIMCTDGVHSSSYKAYQCRLYRLPNMVAPMTTVSSAATRTIMGVL